MGTPASLAALRLLAAFLILAGSWVALRQAVRARLLGVTPWLLALDALPVALAWGLLACLTARPLLAACIVAAVAFGLARGDAAKRNASGEPLVFTDGLLGSIFFYPSLYAEFVTPGVLACSAAAVLMAFVALGAIEPPLWPGPWPGVVAAAAAFGLWPALPTARALLAALRRHGAPKASGRPAQDAAALGPFGAVIVHAATTRLQRPALRRRRAPGWSDTLPPTGPPAGPIVMLQLESFFDARRMGGLVPADLLPHYDRCVAGSIQHGRLQTPAYGANTVRTEFAALTGLPEQALGMDHFNPYAAFARMPVDSIAWRLRAAGFRTICVHPFAGTFYGRNRVMPNLGFDEFLDIDAFPERDPQRTYVSDLAVMAKVAQLLAEHGPRVFVFAITMGNHSPWQRPASNPGAAHPQEAAFSGFLAGLAETDAALGQMAGAMRQDWKHGLLAAFGDHQPSFPSLRRHLGHADRSTDYVIWRAEHAFGEHRDIRAHDLPALVLHNAARIAAARLSPVPHVIGGPA